MTCGPTSVNGHFSPFLPGVWPEEHAVKSVHAGRFTSHPLGSLVSNVWGFGKQCPGGLLECLDLFGEGGSSCHRPWRFLVDSSPATLPYDT